jgi:hypothetical protein
LAAYNFMDQELVNQNQEHLDDWKITLIQLVYTICGSMLSERFFSGLLTGTAPLDAFGEIMGKLGGTPNRGDEISISLRGLKTGPRTSPDLDYQIATGKLSLDLQEAIAIAKRRGSSMMHLQGQLHKAWEVFKHFGITSVVVLLLEPTRENLDLYRSSMHLLSRYYQAIQHDQPLLITAMGKEQLVHVIYDEEKQPDPNLTLLAYLNALTEDEVAELIAQAEQFTRQQGREAGERISFMHPVEALNHMAMARKRLRMPPIRVNTVKWVAIKEQEAVVPKAEVDIAEAIKLIYGRDESKMSTLVSLAKKGGFDTSQAEQFGRGLQEVSDFLVELERKKQFRKVVEKLKTRGVESIKMLPHATLASMAVERGLLKIETGKGTLELGIIPDFLSMLKARIGAKMQEEPENVDAYEKLRKLHNPKCAFTLGELKRLSTDFRVPLDETDMFLKALRRCFDKHGNFSRDLFAEHGLILALYTDQVFPLLLYYLKTTENKKARVSLLNCMPSLFEKVEHPRKIISTLLEEFCASPEKIDHFDRNLLMLATQLLRRYRKEKEVEIETTPEEVLSVEKGLVEDAVQLAQRVIGQSERKIRLKHLAMRNALMASLAQSERERPEGFTPRFLFSLLREFYILMALTGGPVVKGILLDEALALSDPESRFYNQPASKKFLSNILGLFKITVRGYLRLVNGAAEDREHLKAVKTNLPALLSRTLEESHRRVLRQVLSVMDTQLR